MSWGQKVTLSSPCPTPGRGFRGDVSLLREPREWQAGRVDLLAAEQAPHRIPREEDRHLPRKTLARGREAQPLGLVRACHVGFFANALRPDDDVGQIEVD